MTAASEWTPAPGEMAERIRAFDWSRTPLGSSAAWPQTLRTTLGIVLAMPGPATILWGPERVQLYNDAYVAVAQDRHPALLGRPVAEGWPEAYDEVIAPLLAQTDAGRSVQLTGYAVALRGPGGDPVERTFDTAWSPIGDGTGAVAGVLQTLTEVTDGRRAQAKLQANEARQSFLLKLSDALRQLADPGEIQRSAMKLLAETYDVMRAGYLDVDADGDTMTLAAHVERDAVPVPPRIRLSDYGSDMAEAFRAGTTLCMRDTEAEAETAEQRAAYRALGVRSWIIAPLVKNGRLTAIVGVVSRTARDWTPAEIQMIGDLAERTWEAAERARVAAALRDSEERFRAFVNASSDAVYTMSPDWAQMRQLDGRGFLSDTVAPNDAWVQGYIDPDDQPVVRAAIDHAIARKTMFELEHRVRRADGRLGWTQSRAVPILDDAGEISEWLGAASDVTDRKEAEAALRASEERVRGFGEASTDILWIRDAETLAWTYLTPAFETIYGLSRDEALAGNNFRTWLDLILPEDREQAVSAIRRVRDGERATFEYRVRRPCDGAIRWLRNTDFPIRNAEGKVEAIGGVGHDATREKEIEASLRAGRRQWRALVEGVPQLVWRGIDRGEWTWSSPQWTAFTGLSEQASTGRGWLAALHPDDRARAMAAWRQAGETGGPFEVEYRIRQAGGETYRWFQARALPVWGDDPGGVLEWLGTSTDIDDMRRMQEEQAVLVAELHHRTRNLIGVVDMIARQIIASSSSLADFRVGFTERLAALSRVQSLFSRKADEEIAIGDIVRLELDALGARPDDGRVEIAGGHVAVRKSAVQTLLLAIHELATNARKYGALHDGSGKLVVRWSEYRTDGGRRRLRLDWAETGIGPRVEETQGPLHRGGYGRRLIEEALPYTLKAETTYSLGQGWLECTIDMPLER